MSYTSYVSRIEEHRVYDPQLTPYYYSNMVLWEIQIAIDRGRHGMAIPRSLFRRICKRHRVSQHRVFEMLRDNGFTLESGNYRQVSWPLTIEGVAPNEAESLHGWRELGCRVKKGQRSLVRAIFDGRYPDGNALFFKWQTIELKYPALTS